MTKRVIVGVLLAVVAVSTLAAVWLVWAREEGTGAQGDSVEMGIDPEITGNSATSLGTLDSCVRIDVESPGFDGVSDYDIDVYVRGDTQAPVGYDAWVTYDPTKVHIAAPSTNTLIKLPGASTFSNSVPDTDGKFAASVGYLSGGPGTAGDGTLVRLGLDIGGSGLVTFDFDPPGPATAYVSLSGEELVPHPISRQTAQLAINEDCPRGGDRPEPTPTPEQAPIPTPILPMELPGEEEAEQAAEADMAKPRFRGELGDFMVVEPNTGEGYPCPEPYGPVVNPEHSELYFDLSGAMIDEVGSASCQGVIFSITAGVPDETSGTLVGRGYFVDLPLKESFDAPADRLKLITVAGKPALAMLPIPDCISCLSEVVVIERFPSETAPGITAWAHTYNGLDKAIALVEQIMAGKE